jgi:rhodanese-related sulfurtransferase
MVHCAAPTGHALEKLAEDLTTMGYMEVSHYAGGKSDWTQAGLPLASQDDKTS